MAPLLDHSGDLRALASMATEPAALTELLRSALASLARVIPYDLAVLFELDDEVLRPSVSEGPLANEAVRSHSLALRDFPTIRQALGHRRPIALTEHQHAADEGDPFDGVLDLPHGHSCMVVPLYAAGRDLGIITLDRTVCQTYDPAMVELAAVYGQIVSMAIAFADQSRVLERLRRQSREENRLLRASRGLSEAGDKVEAGRAPAMREAARLARQVAEVELPVLIQGETGVGKEVMARAIHEWGPRADAPFITINCAAIPAELVESELFGHVRGAFSGATKNRAGRFSTANGGTLLLDEVGDMPMAAQAKLLRVLQEGTFEPVGADETVRVDVRVIAATHVDLAAAVAEGRFREDLYYRLSPFPVRIPPLRERTEDIVPLATSLLSSLDARTGRGPWSLSDDAQRALLGHPWPGNIRELVNVLERATIVAADRVLSGHDLGLTGSTPPPSREPADDDEGFPTFAEFERAYLQRALDRSGGKVYGPGGAAELVGLKPTTLHSRLKRAGLR